MTEVTTKKLRSTHQRWNCKSVEFVTVIKEKVEYEARLAEIAKILYDEFCQRPKILNHDLGQILEERNCNHG